MSKKSTAELIMNDLSRRLRKHERPGAQTTSAHKCEIDARRCFHHGRYGYAVERAINGLAYHGGVFAPCYRRSLALARGRGLI